METVLGQINNGKVPETSMSFLFCGNDCPLERCTQRERKAFRHCSPSSDVVKQAVGNTMSLRIMDTRYFDVYIIFCRFLLLLKTV